MITNNKWFTLAELLVSISIILILWTIGLLSYTSYMVWIRDSWVKSQLKSLSDWLTSIKANWILPLPLDPVLVNVNWVTIWYQWYLWKNLLGKLWYTAKWKNELTDSYFTYYLTRDRQNFQLLSYFKESDSILSNIITKVNAFDYSNVYVWVYWAKLWILTNENNTPIQEISSIKSNWYIDLILDDADSTFIAHIKNGISYELKWKQLANKLETLSRKSVYWPPVECPDGYIPVWWDAWSKQKWFCVAKYEMSYDWKTWNVNWWNTYSFKNNWDQWKPVSKAWNSPISEINLQEAMTECSTIWKWYHLITNNEWVSIARQIEFEARNWSWNAIWSWALSNWISWSATLGCDWYSSNNKPSGWDAASVTWDNICNWKNVAKLFNWEEIWDYAWNIWEWTNKVFNNKEVFWSNEIEWTAASISEGQLREFWPMINKDLNSWVGRIWNADWYEWRWLKRSWSAWDDEYAWIYVMDPYTDWTEIWENLWFRCTK